MSTVIPTTSDFIVLYPAFAAVSAGQISAQLSLSSRLLSKDAWGDFYSDAIGLDTAHNLAIAQQTNVGSGALQMAAGPISSVSVAGISTSFATMNVDGKSKSDLWYSKTAFGQQFLRLRDTVMPMGVMTA